jgi:TetR/AcrR family transcriptional regulator, transcriptional repressor for nem operon
MPRDGSATRERVMDAAQGLILEQGFSATSVDKVVERAKVTKGTFFYHFPTKRDLAEALVMRWAEWDRAHIERNLARAEKLSRDPLQRVLLFVAFFEEEAESLAEGEPGCLYASYCYEAGLFDEPIHQHVRDSLLQTKRRLLPYFEAAAAAYPPCTDVDLRDLIDMFDVAFEGAFVLSRIHGDPPVVARQLRQYRRYLELLFRAAP